MKTTTLLLLLLLSVRVLGQNESNIDNPKKVQIGLSFSPDYCYRTLFSNYGNEQGLNTFIIKDRNENEIPIFGYHVGFDVCINIKKWLGIQTGLQFSKRGYKTKYTEPAEIAPDPNMPIQAKTIHNFCYLGFPVKVNFIIGQKKVRFISCLGVEPEVFVIESNKSILRYEDGHTSKHIELMPSTLRRISLSLVAGAGIDCRLSRRMNLRIEPIYRYGLIKITNKPISGYLWDYGINVGVYMGL